MLKCSAHTPGSHLTVPIFLMLSFGILHCQAGFSQDKAAAAILPVTVYNVEEGLGQSSVYQVSQDSNGLIWIISGDGLQYFDGSGFRSFYLPDNLSSVNSGNTISGFVETKSEQMFISTVSSVINFNSSTGKFKIIEHRDRQFPRIFNLFYKDKPLCWMTSDGLCLIGNDRLYSVKLDFPGGSSLPAGYNPISAVETNEGNFLLLSEYGYLELKIKYPEQDMVWEAQWVPFKSSCQDVGKGKNGVPCLLSEGIIFSIRENGALEEEFNTGIRESNYFFTDHLNNYWVTDISHKRVYRISSGKMEEIRFVNWNGKVADTLNPTVKYIFEDKNWNLWFGTDGDGLLFYSPDRMIFDLSGIGFTRCISFYEDNIWAGTFKNGLWRMPVDLSSKSRVNPEILTDELYFFDLAEDPMGRLWAATNNGVFVLNERGDVVFQQPLNTSAANFLILPGGKLLLSSYSQLYSCETGSRPGLTYLRDQTNIKEFITFEGSYWVGNQFGLFRKDTALGVLSSLMFDEKDRLSSTPVCSILPKDGYLWIGTEDGIECYTPAGRKIPAPECTVTMKHEIIYSLLADIQNRIWFAGNNGAGCIPPARDRIIRFSSINNLQSQEFNFNAKLAIPQGRIFLGGIKGINGLNTNDFIIKDASPEVRLISLTLSDSAFTPGIPPKDAHVDIHWTSPHLAGTVYTPDYLPAGTAKYSFLLEGYQDNWSEPSFNAGFSFRNLPPGNYRLLAKCIDSFQNKGPVKCLLNITIRPPFWKTWWFMMISAMLVIGSTVLVIRKIQEAKYRELLMDLEKRNAIDRERLRISQDMHDEIGASLTQIAILSEIVKTKNNDQEEVMKLINRISGISGTVVDDLGEIIWAMNPKNDDLPSFVAYLREHASEYLATAGIDGKFSFPDECPQIPMASEQRRNIFLVVKEALHNVVKHSGADEVNVSLGLSDKLILINIEDNGKGFETDKCSGIGNGLTSMRGRIEALGGSYSITSMTGEGTQIQFSVTLDPS